jgi:cytochrome c-type biogenesis protein
MSEFIVASGSCLLAGLLTTIHPCPMTTNIASISFLSGLTANRKNSAAVIIFFTGGYLISYLLLGIVISSGLFSIPLLSVRLQKSINLFIGPVLIISGMILADVFRLQKFYKGRIVKYLQARKWTGAEVIPFGILMALSFCPATAAIFFGLLIPLAVRYEQMILFPLIYAFGASLPIIIISILVSKGILLSGNTGWIRNLPVISGWLLIIIGVYISIKRIYLI